MAQNLKICEIDPELLAKVKKFRFRKEPNNAAVVMKIDIETSTVIEDESYEDVDIEELVSELPAHLPRYIALSYVKKHDDGRVSYPLIFVFISPSGIKPALQMTYAGSKTSLVNALGFTKVFELRDVEEFTEEWLLEKLKFFK
ncbi:glia maturation factor gamma-like [Clytia hemisphaerica]|uniref:glia maturation factor gamma-like n=1 Tax=Clytia hemisphaerica TaxID=252671 RepID=UPI0034D5D2EC